MKHKYKEQDIIDFLYGSLNQTEHAMMEQAIHDDKELEAEVRSIAEVMGVLGKLEDKEVIPPAFIFDGDNPNKSNTHKYSFTKKALAIAAAISLILLTSYLTGIQFEYSAGKMAIGFANETQTTDKMQIRSLMKEVLEEYDDQNKNKIDRIQSELTARINNIEEERIDSMQDLITGYSENSQAVMKEYVRQVNKENLEMIQNFFLVSSEKQQVYLNAVLADFNKFYQDQREHDLKMIETGIYTIQNRNKAKQLETDQVLANLMDIVKTQNK